MGELEPVWESPDRLRSDLKTAMAATMGKIVESSQGADSIMLHLPSATGESLPKLYLSAGIHGDEPAGPLAILQLLRTPGFFDGVEVYIFPLLNPSGLAVGQRENERGVDLNRNYGPGGVDDPDTLEHKDRLNQLPRLDVALCLHEDWEANGVYLYHVEPKMPRFDAKRVLHAMQSVLPVETSCVIDGSQACGGIISRQEADYIRDDWPESVYLTRTRTRASFTMETPSSVPLAARVAAHCAGVLDVIHQLKET